MQPKGCRMPWVATAGCNRVLQRTSPLLSCAMCLNSFLRPPVTCHSQVKPRQLTVHAHQAACANTLVQAVQPTLRPRRLYEALAGCLGFGNGCMSKEVV
jgi:hypothetical protein